MKKFSESIRQFWGTYLTGIELRTSTPTTYVAQHQRPTYLNDSPQGLVWRLHSLRLETPNALVQALLPCLISQDSEYNKKTIQENIRKSWNINISRNKQKTVKKEVKSLKIAKYDKNWQIVLVKQKTIENKSLPLWNKTISMEDINRLKVVLVEKKRTARWLSM